SVDPQGRYVYVRVVTPTVDQAQASDVEHVLKRTLEQDQFETIVVDLSAVEYVSSASLRVLATFRRQLVTRGKTCALVARSKTLLEIFRVSGFNVVFEVFHSSEDALKKFAQ